MVFCLFVMPVFLFILINNHLFLLLDYVFFPRFTRQKIKQPVFIISAPRSATTYLFHSLAQNSETYTCVKLWEIVFAPSILQKYIVLGLFKFDANVGSPLKKSVRYIEQLIMGNFNKIHVMGLELPEEDEGFLLWNFSTLYLSFFYCDSEFFQAHYQFDRSMKDATKRRIMNTYRRYILRHNFVFNRQGNRQFLSKNPLMMNKINSLYNIFPDCFQDRVARAVADGCVAFEGAADGHRGDARKTGDIGHGRGFAGLGHAPVLSLPWPEIQPPRAGTPQLQAKAT